MATAAPLRTPVHLWIVGVLSLIWNCFGAYDYLETKWRNLDYLASMAPPGVDPATMLSYIEGMPLYAQVGWGLGVWMALLGSVLLLLRRRFAVWSFAISIVGMALSFGYMFLVQTMPGSDAAGAMKYMPLLIVALGIAQFAYARAVEKKGMLH